jgi:hypothetical protein
MNSRRRRTTVLSKGAVLVFDFFRIQSRRDVSTLLRKNGTRLTVCGSKEPTLLRRPTLYIGPRIAESYGPFGGWSGALI